MGKDHETGQLMLPVLSFNDAEGKISFTRVPVKQLGHQRAPKPKKSLNSYFRQPRQLMKTNEITDGQVVKKWGAYALESVEGYLSYVKHFIIDSKRGTLGLLLLAAFLSIFIWPWWHPADEWGHKLLWGTVPGFLMILAALALLKAVGLSVALVIVRTRVTILWLLGAIFTMVLLLLSGVDKTGYLTIGVLVVALGVLPLLRILNAFIFKQVWLDALLRNKTFMVGDVDNYLDSRAAWRSANPTKLVRAPKRISKKKGEEA